jgi:two-component system sensor kinase FixL
MEQQADPPGSRLSGRSVGISKGKATPSASPDMLIRTMEGRLTFWSPGMEQRYGFTNEQALGQTSHQLLKTIFPKALNEIEDTLQSQSNWSGGLIHRHSDGRSIMVVGHWYLQRAVDGRDAVVTEVHSRAVGRELADLIAMLAHELSEPLTAISNYINAAQRIADGAWPNREGLRNAMAQAANQIARGAAGINLMRDLANELRSTC